MPSQAIEITIDGVRYGRMLPVIIRASAKDRTHTRSMRRAKPREAITLLDVLIDGFEKNEITIRPTKC